MRLTVLYSQSPGVAVQTDSNSICEALSPEQVSSGPAGTQVPCWVGSQVLLGLHFLIHNVGKILTARPHHSWLNQEQRAPTTMWARPKWQKTTFFWKKPLTCLPKQDLFLQRCQQISNSALIYNIIPEKLPSLPDIQQQPICFICSKHVNGKRTKWNKPHSLPLRSSQSSSSNP